MYNFYFLSFSSLSNQFLLEMNPQWYFFLFLIFFGIFFCAFGRNETKRNDNFYFPYFSSFSDRFWLEMNPNRISFFFFWIFYYFYGIFYYTSGRNGTEWNDNFCFSLSHLFPTYFGLKWILNGIFEFFEFFCYFFKIFYYASGRNETEQ